ncbi:TRAP transporter small permease [Pseudomonas sp. GOM7]|uniref:TRAP transporter small permease n=1 Tax=unclassified Pseudomonas TaxID=196821 RepID=UPI00227B2735|nr:MULTISPECIES: TRAP transporter small permease [unclassified Pseudomonas]WAJ37810.1 TRAP transporter small permease [Pseudomonas sp. GOM7]
MSEVHLHAGQPISAGRVFDGVATMVRCITGLALVLLVLLVCAEIVARFFFNHSLKVVEELAGYLVVGLTLFGASLSLRSNSLFQVGFVLHALSAGLQRLFNLCFQLVSLGVCGVLIWQTFKLVMSSYARGNVAPTTLMTPLWLPQLLVPLGLLMIALFIVEHLIVTLRGGRVD